MPHQRYFTQAVFNDGCHGNTLSRTQRYSVEFGKAHLHRPLCCLSWQSCSVTAGFGIYIFFSLVIVHFSTTNLPSSVCLDFTFFCSCFENICFFQAECVKCTNVLKKGRQIAGVTDTS